MTIEWNQIKSFNNSQHSAFEELVCQLAREEDIPESVRFFRIAAPDAGVEAYCVLKNGEEYGWQAKYFSAMGASQWAQVKKSFETALRTHPKLTRYYVCIPLDRNDPRKENQKWFMDHWNDKETEWKEIAAAQGRNIEIIYWGSSELIHKLSTEKNSGKKFFWFSSAEFSKNWFERLTNLSIKDLGKRYTPKANINLDINFCFEAMARSTLFIEHSTNTIEELETNLNTLLKFSKQYISSQTHKKAIKNIGTIKSSLDPLILSQLTIGIPWQKITSSFEHLNSITTTIEDSLKEIEEHQRRKTSNKLLSNLKYSFAKFTKFIKDSKTLSTSPYMLLYGEAGIGKSHLLGDLCLRKMHAQTPGILILGQHLTSDEAPWTQILRNILRLSCSEEELLGALNSQAESKGERILFVVDAINEGRGKFFWANYIHSFVESFKAFPWIGLVLSIRTSYVNILRLQDNPVDKLTHTKHRGFIGREDEAASLFFEQYGIIKPATPLLNPEFSNPLFLRLFCEGARGRNKNLESASFQGLNNIIEHYFESVNRELSSPSRFDYPSQKNLVKTVSKNLVTLKYNSNIQYVDYDTAYSLAEETVKKYSDKRRFLDELISEGVLSKNAFWNNQKEAQEGVYLSYEKFEDHLFTRHLITSEINPENIKSAFAGDGSLAKIINNPAPNQGIIESLSIQLPDLFDTELYEVLPLQYKHSKAISAAFVNSMGWRTPKTVKKSSWNYIKDSVLSDKEMFDLLIHAVYSVAGEPDHFYNADSLHRYLNKMSMAERDTTWTHYINLQEDDTSSIWRLVRWAASIEDKVLLCQKSRRLCAIAISWLFSSTNIKLRDTATKSLAKLLIDDLPLANYLILLFKDINDLYILDRIYAASFGAVVNSDELYGLVDLCNSILGLVKTMKEFYPNVLIRDYARGIVEYATTKHIVDASALTKISPPFKSSLPTNLPSNEEIDAYKKEWGVDGASGVNTILSSMVTEYGRGVASYGDFGRYTFESAVRNWDCDANLLSNYACKLIFEEYDYKAEKQGIVDSNSSSSNRFENKIERLGKKYQWIALYEIVARLADNHMMFDETKGWRNNDEKTNYEGPWNPGLRNIDPTLIQRPSQSEIRFCFWEKPHYNNWGFSNKYWLSLTTDLPNPEQIISFTDPNGIEWLVLERYLDWKEPDFINSDYDENNKKNIWLQCRSYFIKKEESKKIIKNLRSESFMGRWMPESKSQYQVFSREYYWSSAYRYFQKDYYGWSSWEELRHRGEDYSLGSVQVTTEGHHWETGGGDDSQQSYLSPRVDLYEGLKLKYSSKIGEWLDSSGKLAAFDPAANSATPSCLLIRKDLLVRYLDEHNLKIIWTFLGEKNTYGGFNGGDQDINWLEISGLYTLNKELTGSLNIISKNNNSE